MTTSKPVRTKADYRAASARVETIFLAQPGDPKFDKLDVLTKLIEACDAYEAQHCPIPAPVERKLNQTNTGPIIGYLFLFGLFFCACTMIGCRSQQTVHVMDFPKARVLGAEYLHRYNSRQKPAYWVGPPPSCVYLRRSNATGEPIILSRVDELLENGTLRSSPSAIITIVKSTHRLTKPAAMRGS